MESLIGHLGKALGVAEHHWSYFRKHKYTQNTGVHTLVFGTLAQVICNRCYIVLLQIICFASHTQPILESCGLCFNFQFLHYKLLGVGSFSTFSHQSLVSQSTFELLVCWSALLEGWPQRPFLIQTFL